MIHSIISSCAYLFRLLLSTLVILHNTILPSCAHNNHVFPYSHATYVHFKCILMCNDFLLGPWVPSPASLAVFSGATFVNGRGDSATIHLRFVPRTFLEIVRDYRAKQFNFSVPLCSSRQSSGNIQISIYVELHLASPSFHLTLERFMSIQLSPRCRNLLLQATCSPLDLRFEL